MASLAKLGVDLGDVADVLEQQGVASFAQSWDDLIKSVQERLENAGADAMPGGASHSGEKRGGLRGARSCGAGLKSVSGLRNWR